MKVRITNDLTDIFRNIENAASKCYDSTPTERFKILQKCIASGHDSILEHSHITFEVEGVSRALLAQITRHRIASFSVQSQRYVKKSNFVYITPPEIEKNKDAFNLFEKSMKDSIDSYNKIADTLEKDYLESYLKNGMDEKKAKNIAKISSPIFWNMLSEEKLLKVFEALKEELE